MKAGCLKGVTSLLHVSLVYSFSMVILVIGSIMDISCVLVMKGKRHIFNESNMYQINLPSF